MKHDRHAKKPLSRRRLLQGSAATGAAIWFARTPGRSAAAARIPAAMGHSIATPELPEDAAPQDQQILRTMGREGRYLDWSKSVQQRQFESALITEPLVRRNENYELVPAGAESWETSEDDLTWTFHLRPGMTWSDGTPVTAEDYAYTVRRMADPATAIRRHLLLRLDQELHRRRPKATVPVDEVGVEAIDDLTLAITTSQPTPFLGLITADIYVVPKHIVERARRQLVARSGHGALVRPLHAGDMGQGTAGRLRQQPVHTTGRGPPIGRRSSI